jgi:hypothetical protein
MLEDLLDSPAKLAFAIALLSVVNYFAARLALAAQSRLSVVGHGDQAVGAGEDAASERRALAKKFIMPAIIAGFMFIADRFTREFLGGGWLVMQIASLGSAMMDIFALKALQRPGAAEGRIHYSSGYRYRLTAARSLGMAIVAAAVGLLFDSWAFAGAALLMLATGLGWYRRARQSESGHTRVEIHRT